MSPLMTWIVVACLAATAFMAASVLFRRERAFEHELAERRRNGYSFTTADYGADMKCDICFDDIGSEQVSECTCGKVYHTSCAEPTGECPYCGAPYASFRDPRPPRHVTCPRCGEVMGGNICSCGTVIPDSDGTFLCRCGDRASVDDAICRRCGRTFGSSVCAVRKEFIPNR